MRARFRTRLSCLPRPRSDFFASVCALVLAGCRGDSAAGAGFCSQLMVKNRLPAMPTVSIKLRDQLRDLIRFSFKPLGFVLIESRPWVVMIFRSLMLRNKRIGVGRDSKVKERRAANIKKHDKHRTGVSAGKFTGNMLMKTAACSKRTGTNASTCRARCNDSLQRAATFCSAQCTSAELKLQLI